MNNIANKNETKTDNSDKIKHYRGDKQRPLLKKRFLELLLHKSVLGNVTKAVEIMGLNRDTVYDWKSKDSEFAACWNRKIQETNDFLADEAENALLNGIRAGNASLIIFTLKNRRPQKWKDRFEHTAKSNETIKYEPSPEFTAFLKKYKEEHKN